MKNHKYISKEIAEQLIDFSGGNSTLESLGNIQLDGAVALYNKLVRHGIGYLADEVGMGKTFVALGVVSLLRYFNPSLRVLYILPKQNILTKWKVTDFTYFLKHNFKVANYKVKTSEHNPSSPQIECENLESLIRHSATGYYGDYFIKMSSFSFGLSDDKGALKNSLKALKSVVPAYTIQTLYDKEDVKEEYARTINQILPHFDLVVIDEAHNFRKDFESSYRNKLLSIILGTHPSEGLKRRVDSALLLSATPYQNSIDELQNQLLMVGSDLKDFTLNKKMPVTHKETKNAMKKFMVRRLNELPVNGENYTRNMYREEFRDKVITFAPEDVRQKLIVALVQKKVGELILNMKGQYQTGMLASFESYIPSSKKIEVEFDGEEKNRGEAADNSIITVLTDSYKNAFNEKTLPHPKMDNVVLEYGDSAFKMGKKHLVFVRRIMSVRDLKRKFDQRYDDWLYAYIAENIRDEKTKKELLALFDVFKKDEEVEAKDSNETDDTSILEDSDDTEEEAKPSKSNFFTYYFRGKFEGERGDFIRPLTFRKYLTDSKKYELAKLFLSNGEFYLRLANLIDRDLSNLNDFQKEVIFSMLRYGHGFIDMYISYLNGKEHFLDNFFDLLRAQKEKVDPFSTYRQLQDLVENIDLVIKTTFPEWEKTSKTYRRYIQDQISPLEPVSGSTGSDDKSAIARKFRMPGYPMILISTDVLQEGEDLHTFCDSIIHYGLSSTPISIEQKTGRVDRVGSLAQRRLQQLSGTVNIATDGIKVAFPHIKESIERIQVRSIAERLNRFLASLHDFEASHADNEFQREEQLSDKSPIPSLTKAKLTSPYVVTQDDLKPSDRTLEDLNITADENYIKEIKTYIMQLIQANEIHDLQYDLEAAMNPYELVLKISSNHEEPLPETKKQILRQMKQSYESFNRTYCHAGNLMFDAHTLVGDATLTQASEIDELLDRVRKGRSEILDSSEIILKDVFDAKLLENELFVRNHKVEAELSGDTISFTFHSGRNKDFEYTRSQKVNIAQEAGYVVLTSKAAKWEEWGKTGCEMLRKYTWERNAQIDLVEFLLNDRQELLGRIVHPASTLQPKELMYFAYILACESDHLEQVLNDFSLGDRF